MVRSVTDEIEERLGQVVRLPVVGEVTLPHPDTLVYYAGIGVLVALELVEWPIALIVSTGHLMADRHHRSVIRGLGEALEQA
jgi:hypothetical protein